MQRRTPDAIRSRVAGALDSVVHIGLAVSYLIAGPAVHVLGAKGTYLVGGIVSFVAVGVLLPILRERAPVQEPLPHVEPSTDATELVFGYQAGESEAAGREGSGYARSVPAGSMPEASA